MIKQHGGAILANDGWIFSFFQDMLYADRPSMQANTSNGRDGASDGEHGSSEKKTVLHEMVVLADRSDRDTRRDRQVVPVQIDIGHPVSSAFHEHGQRGGLAMA
jgi:hypothetical protein